MSHELSWSTKYLAKIKPSTLSVNDIVYIIPHNLYDISIAWSTGYKLDDSDDGMWGWDDYNIYNVYNTPHYSYFAYVIISDVEAYDMPITHTVWLGDKMEPELFISSIYACANVIEIGDLVSRTSDKGFDRVCEIDYDIHSDELCIKFIYLDDVWCKSFELFNIVKLGRLGG